MLDYYRLLTSLRLRTGPLVLLVVNLLIALALGLSNEQPDILKQHDKLLHFTVFCVLTANFYCIILASRQLTFYLTLTTAVVMCVGSEFLQASLPNNRTFDILDILANLFGSSISLVLCVFFHRRISFLLAPCTTLSLNHGILRSRIPTNYTPDNDNVELESGFMTLSAATNSVSSPLLFQSPRSSE